MSELIKEYQIRLEQLNNGEPELYEGETSNIIDILENKE